jgi:hypothetical protein
MIEWLLTMLVFVAVMAGMAIGVIKGRDAISGSCGGLNRIPGVESDCGGTCRAKCKKRKG